MKIDTSQIDWKNHLVAFLSALIGIIIAFELEDYKDRRREEAAREITIDAIRQEVEKNIAIYKANWDTVSLWLKYYDVNRSRNSSGEVRMAKATFDELRSVRRDRTRSWQLLKSDGDTVQVRINPDEFLLDVAPEVGVSTSSWQAAVYSGSLKGLDGHMLTKLNQIYEWTTKDIGLSDREFYQNVIFPASEYTDLDAIVSFYRKLVRHDQMKYQRLKSYYDEIKWQ